MSDHPFTVLRARMARRCPPLLLWLLLMGQPLATAVAADCDQPATPIHAIQGSGGKSPLVGSVRTVEAVVTASFQGKDRLNGFFIQEQDSQADADAATSEGLFVYAPGSRGVAVGERVRVTGVVSEFRHRTELKRVRSLVVCGNTPLPMPARISLPLSDGGDLERLEGMRVELAGPLVVTGVYRLGRYGHVTLSGGGRLYQPTQRQRPGPDAAALAAINERSRLILDDGSRRLHPPPPIVERQAGAAQARPVRAGDGIEGVRGVLDQFGGIYLLQPVAPPRFGTTNPRPAAPTEPRAEQLRVAAFNVHNYFNGDGAGGGFPTARGAENPHQFRRQRQKIISALNGLRADVIALAEIENDGFGPASAVADLARGLSAAAGVRYQSVEPDLDRLGSGQIAVGLLYRPDRVRPVGPPAVLHAGVDGRFSAGNRPSLAQTFEQRANGERLTIVANHFKSKGSSCADAGDPDRGDGQGHCNRTRLMAAKALAAWMASDPTTADDPDVMIVGDLNAYAREEPIEALTGRGYVDLIRRHLGERAYTFVYDGQAGYLDHALASTALAPQVAGIRIWHINADEPSVANAGSGRTSSSGPYGSSDHDPVIVDLDLGANRLR
jgi:predicted extracellular nuclease